MRLLLIRHGQTPSNVLGVLDTAVPGPGLTELGLRQAEALAGALAEEPIDALFASVQTRARQTAAPLAAVRGLEIQVREGIREVGAGDLEMAGDEESVRRYLGTVFGWSDGELAVCMPGGRTGRVTLADYDAVIAEAAAHDTAALVSHGAAIRMWVASRAANIDSDFAARHWLDNTGVIVVEGAPDIGWKMLSWMSASVGPEPADPRDAGPAAEPVPESTADTTTDTTACSTISAKPQ